jgi:hypothetical protein
MPGSVFVSLRSAARSHLHPRCAGAGRDCSAAATREFGQFPATQDVARLQARIDLNEMILMRLYGMPTGPGPASEYDDELRSKVGRYFPLLRDCVRAMSDKGKAC